MRPKPAFLARGRFRRLRMGVLLVCVVASPPSTITVKAQIDRATLSGTITDPSGAAVPGARVVAVEVSTRTGRETVSGENGTYHLPALPVGRYKVTVTKDQFRKAEYQGIELLVGQNETLDVPLQLGSAETQTVQISGTAPELDRVTPTISGIIGSAQIDELPTNGRNWASLLIFVPGAVDDGGGDQRTIRFAGRGRDDNNYMMDGIDATGIQEQAQKSTTRLQISEEAVAEYRVSSMLYTAEHGAGAGGQVDLVSKTGTNVFHGSLFEFFRNSALDARAFNDFDAVTGLPVIPPFHLN